MKNAIVMSIAAPSDFAKAPEGYTRTFYIGTVHDGVAEILAEAEGTTIEFSSGKFSTYSLAYKDTKLEEEGKDGSDDSGKDDEKDSGKKGDSSKSDSKNNSKRSTTRKTTKASTSGLKRTSSTAKHATSAAKTGDESDIVLWIAIHVAMAIILNAVIYRRKRNEN